MSGNNLPSGRDQVKVDYMTKVCNILL